MARRKQEALVKGTATHRRTENDYMAVLLETVTLEDWRQVVARALWGAKHGNPSARAWLTQYLMGKPEGAAPTPLAVVVQQWNGDDPVASRLAKPIIDRALYPGLYENEKLEETMRALVAQELGQKLAADTNTTAEQY